VFLAHDHRLNNHIIKDDLHLDICYVQLFWSLTIISSTRIKIHYNGLFWKSQCHIKKSESSIVALYSNEFAKLGKSEMKNWNLHSNLSNPNIFYQKDKCSIQGGIYKGWCIQCFNLNYPKKIIIMEIIFLVELETKPMAFYHHIIIVKMKKSNNKSLSKNLRFKM
jgi:hypothetical protein